MKLDAPYYAFALLFMLSLDGIWLSATNKMYTRMTASIQNAPVVTNYTGVVFAYACLYVALICFALPNIVRETTHRTSADALFVKCLQYGGLLGAVTYGVYNGTNKALLSKYTWQVAALDTTWGATMMTLTCFFTVLSVRALQKRKPKSKKDCSEKLCATF